MDEKRLRKGNRGVYGNCDKVLSFPYLFFIYFIESSCIYKIKMIICIYQVKETLIQQLGKGIIKKFRK